VVIAGGGAQIGIDRTGYVIKYAGFRAHVIRSVTGANVLVVGAAIKRHVPVESDIALYRNCRWLHRNTV